MENAWKRKEEPYSCERDESSRICKNHFGAISWKAPEGSTPTILTYFVNYCGLAMYTSRGCSPGRTRRMISLGQRESLKTVTQPSLGSQTAQQV